MGSGSMVYTINQKVITLKEYGLDRFWSELKRIREENKLYDKRNIEWFDILPDTFMNYPEWFFLFDDDKPVAFSTIQKYYDGCYRVLTRTYIYRDYRRFTNPKTDTFLSPTMRILPYQLDYIKGYKTAFVSMQTLSRRQAIKYFSVKMNYRTSLDWNLADNMMLTCADDYGKDCWQNIIYNGEKPNLPEITIEEWKHRYG
jgi:hypothetical protein